MSIVGYRTLASVSLGVICLVGSAVLIQMGDTETADTLNKLGEGAVLVAIGFLKLGQK